MEERLFYRYDAIVTVQGIEITLRTFKAVRETNCFFIVRAHTINQYGYECLYGKERRVPKHPNHCRAICHTKDVALSSFKKRQEMRTFHAERNRQIAKRCLAWIGSDGRPPDGSKNIGHTQITSLGIDDDREW